ncbi:hypothetical protein [Pseudoxanthomonas sp. JBR18]|uniref:hypothetical protein n=1 Tax=Pseudoxanthomonas sp. JBR18 TaxID=2969308 RepID=UPI0023057B0F|nr:hypothetical protein [Pseudoxanthomonas sp. JBR18]WCE05185.1 hypothetical protein PJ250_04175 [Pseudoxanthomonas sp. JBR18]
MRDGALVVISVSLVVNHAADFMQAGEDIRVQHVGAVGAVEVFDIGILGGIPRLDVQQLDALVLGPLFPRRTDELRAVVPRGQAAWPSRSRLGTPRSSTSSSTARITRAEGRLVSISIRSDSRLKSSLTLKVRKRRPDHIASAMKSADQV